MEHIFGKTDDNVVNVQEYIPIDTSSIIEQLSFDTEPVSKGDTGSTVSEYSINTEQYRKDMHTKMNENQIVIDKFIDTHLSHIASSGIQYHPDTRTRISALFREISIQQHSSTDENKIIDLCSSLTSQTNVIVLLNQIPLDTAFQLLKMKEDYILDDYPIKGKHDMVVDLFYCLLDFINQTQTVIDHTTISNTSSSLFSLLHQHLFSQIDIFYPILFTRSINASVTSIFSGSYAMKRKQYLAILWFYAKHIPIVKTDMNIKIQLIHFFVMTHEHSSSSVTKTKISKQVWSDYKQVVYYNPNHYSLTLDEHITLTYKLFNKKYTPERRISLFKQLELSPYYLEGIKYNSILQFNDGKKYANVSVIDPAFFEGNSELKIYYENFMNHYISK